MSKREDLTLCSYKNNNNKRIKRREETFGGDGYVYNIDCLDGFIDAYILLSKYNKLYTLNMYSFRTSTISQ